MAAVIDIEACAQPLGILRSGATTPGELPCLVIFGRVARMLGQGFNTVGAQTPDSIINQT